MRDAVPEPGLDDEQRRLFERGVAEFNDRHYFECHDTLEEMWAGLRGPARDFFQGLIQVSVAFYHLGGGNLAGARSMLSRALKRFEPYPGRYFGFELGRHRDELRAWLERIDSGDLDEIGRHAPPRWDFD